MVDGSVYSSARSIEEEIRGFNLCHYNIIHYISLDYFYLAISIHFSVC